MSSLENVSNLLEELTSIWQEIVAIRGDFVPKGQTRTPRKLVTQMISNIPLLSPQGIYVPDGGAESAVKTGRRNPSGLLWRTVLDPACGAGILIGSICLRDLKYSHTVTQAIQFGSEYIEGLGHNFSAKPAVNRVFKDIKDYIRGLISSLFAIDIDEISCVFTRMSLCCFGPVVRAVQALDMAVHDGSTSFSLPRFQVFCGSSPNLYFGGGLRAPKHDLLDTGCPCTRLAPLWKRSFDIIVQNPPFRNMERDHLQNSGNAFQFLSGLQGNTNWAKCLFCHHNLYGYFLKLGLDRLKRNGIMVAVVLRNVFDLHKYPQDAGFHFEILRETTILAISYGCHDGIDREFQDLPTDARHKRAGGIETVTLVLRASHPGPEHRFDVHVASHELTHGHDVPPSISTVQYLQSGVLSSGLGIIDPVLCSKYGAKGITAQWVSLSKSMK